MLRALMDWELKYYKLCINKGFKFFKWEISFNFQILNGGIHKEWEKFMKEHINNSTTVTDNKDIWYAK